MGWETKTAPWAVVFVYWKRPEYPVRLAAGMNGRISNCAPGGARLANKVFPVPRLIPRRGNPREPLAAGIGRGKFISSAHYFYKDALTATHSSPVGESAYSGSVLHA